MTEFEQLSLWVEGQSVHDGDRQTCCPDFSCCWPELQADQHDRWRYMNAWISAAGQPGNEDTLRGQLAQSQMLAEFMERLVRRIGGPMIVE